MGNGIVRDTISIEHFEEYTSTYETLRDKGLDTTEIYSTIFESSDTYNNNCNSSHNDYDHNDHSCSNNRQNIRGTNNNISDNNGSRNCNQAEDYQNDNSADKSRTVTIQKQSIIQSRGNSGLTEANSVATSEGSLNKFVLSQVDNSLASNGNSSIIRADDSNNCPEVSDSSRNNSSDNSYKGGSDNRHNFYEDEQDDHRNRKCSDSSHNTRHSSDAHSFNSDNYSHNRQQEQAETYIKEVDELLLSSSLDHNIYHNKNSLKYSKRVEELYFGENCAMVIDDNKSSAKHTESLLQKVNFKVFVALNVDHGLELLSQEYKRLKVIFVNIIMPIVDGFECLQLIKNNSNYSKIPVYMLSSIEDNELADLCIKSGAEAVMLKPLEEFLLKEIIYEDINEEDAWLLNEDDNSSVASNSTSVMSNYMNNLSINGNKGLGPVRRKHSLLKRTAHTNIKIGYQMPSIQLCTYNFQNYPISSLDHSKDMILMVFVPTLFFKSFYEPDGFITSLYQQCDKLEYEKRVSIVVISNDLPYSLAKAKQRFNLPFLLLSDPSLYFSRRYVGVIDIGRISAEEILRNNDNKSDKSDKSENFNINDTSCSQNSTINSGRRSNNETKNDDADHDSVDSTIDHDINHPLNVKLGANLGMLLLNRQREIVGKWVASHHETSLKNISHYNLNTNSAVEPQDVTLGSPRSLSPRHFTANTIAHPIVPHAVANSVPTTVTDLNSYPEDISEWIKLSVVRFMRGDHLYNRNTMDEKQLKVFQSLSIDKAEDVRTVQLTSESLLHNSMSNSAIKNNSVNEGNANGLQHTDGLIKDSNTTSTNSNNNLSATSGTIALAGSSSIYNDHRSNTKYILVIDDSIITLKLLTKVLEKMNYSVLCANNAQNGYDILKKNPRMFDMVFLDIVMPVCDGLELLKILKWDNDTRNLNVVMLAELVGEELSGECFALGASAILVKPVDEKKMQLLLHGSHPKAIF